MCGRYRTTVTIEELEQRFGAIYTGEPLPANFDARPTQHLYTILNRDPKQALLARWNYTAFKGSKPLINARAESLATKHMYKEPLEKRRCLIPATGFYEWLGEVGHKRKFRFELQDHEPFAFAGIWQEEYNEAGILEPHFAIITTTPNEVVASIHNRMPAILIPDDEAKWLSLDLEPREALSLIQPYPADAMHIIEEPSKSGTIKQNSA